MDSIEWLLHDSALTLAALDPICVGWNFGLSDKGLKRRPTLAVTADSVNDRMGIGFRHVPPRAASASASHSASASTCRLTSK